MLPEKVLGCRAPTGFSFVESSAGGFERPYLAMHPFFPFTMLPDLFEDTKLLLGNATKHATLNLESIYHISRDSSTEVTKINGSFIKFINVSSLDLEMFSGRNWFVSFFQIKTRR